MNYCLLVSISKEHNELNKCKKKQICQFSKRLLFDLIAIETKCICSLAVKTEILCSLILNIF